MKEAIGGISIFQIVIIFILLFAGIMCLTINHSIAFGVKDEVVNIIQEEKVVNDKTLGKIAELLNNAGYRVTGNCSNNDWTSNESGWVGYDRTGKQVNKNPSFCIRKMSVSESFDKDVKEKCKSKCNFVSESDLDLTYYEVLLFYQLDIPGLNDIMTFKLAGNTRAVFSGGY